MFVLNHELTYTLITGYSTVLRNRVIKRWLELENKLENKTLDSLKQKAWTFVTDEVRSQMHREAVYKGFIHSTGKTGIL